MSKIFYRYIIGLVLLLCLLSSIPGCLKDNVATYEKYDDNDAVAMLIYFENHGDFINSGTSSYIYVTPDQLYSNLSNYLILDIRDSLLFSAGHINGAKNIITSKLIPEIKKSTQNAIVIVSQTGQSASYYATLLRLYGFSNVYILKFGMAGWNSEFATDWSEYNGSEPNKFEYFNNISYPFGKYFPLPIVKIPGNGDIKEKIGNRIESLLSESFDDGIRLIGQQQSSEASIYQNDVFKNYNSVDSSFGDQYIVCYGAEGIYFAGRQDVRPKMHPPHSVLYNYNHDLKSLYHLQTIHSDKLVVVYSRFGHDSAILTAYLRVLGYNAKSLLFGAFWLGGFPGSANYPYVVETNN